MLTPRELSDIDEREQHQFERFAREHPNGVIHVKRWDRLLRAYECGHVRVVDGRIDPVVNVPMGGGPPMRFSFDTLVELIVAGWIGD